MHLETDTEASYIFLTSGNQTFRIATIIITITIIIVIIIAY